MPKRLDLSGRVFGSLKVLECVGIDKHGFTQWRCSCLCGKETIVRGSSLAQNWTTSCGCVGSEAMANTGKRGINASYYRHGHTSSNGIPVVSPEYKTWKGMKQRCFNSTRADYVNHGGRGITVCDRWRDSFTAFLEDMGPRLAGLTIERIDNDGDYEPGNCCWDTRKAQRKNQRPRKRKCASVESV